ncbi:MAG TPA: GGDEF domain-containing protein [Anaerolineae bacterium]|nr:GGDEF domain-containing protein [Anaerolineae bacterium]
MTHEDKKKMPIQDIHDLSRVFIEAVKEISDSGKSLTLDDLYTNLAQREDVKNLIERSGKKSKKSRTHVKEVAEYLKTPIEANDTTQKKLFKQLGTMDSIINSEKEFNKRISLTMLNMNQLTGNETFFNLLEEYKHLVVEGYEIDRREALLNDLKNLLLKSTIVKDKIAKNRSILENVMKRGKDTSLETLKNVCLETLIKLQVILGEEYDPELSTFKSRIIETNNIEYLLSQKAAILSIIENYIDRIQHEKKRIIDFIKEIGDKLVDLEKDLSASSTISSFYHKDDYSFSENLESEIKHVSEMIKKSENDEALKSPLISRLENIIQTLAYRRQEYSVRLEKAEDERKKLNINFDNMINSLRNQNKLLEEQSRRDALTNIFNRRVFEEKVSAELARYIRYKKPFSLIFFDIDRFKNVNDTYGHDTGDRVLKEITARTREALRKTDIFARYGGEEFVIILPETDLTQAVNVAEKLHDIIQKNIFEHEGDRIPITVSVGVTEVQESDRDPESILHRADSNMYKAKDKGRNRVVSDFDVKKIPRS